MLTIAGRCKSRLIPMFRREWQVELARNAGSGSFCVCVCAFSLVYVTYDKLTNVSPLECVPMSRRQVVPKSVRGAQVPCPLGDSSCGASAADIWRPGQMGLGLGPSSWLLRTLTAEDLVQPSFCFFSLKKIVYSTLNLAQNAWMKLCGWETLIAGSFSVL